MRKGLGAMFLCAGSGFFMSSRSITGNVVGSTNSLDYFGILGFIFLLSGLALLVSGKSLRDVVTSTRNSDKKVDSLENELYSKSSIPSHN
jgi:hypothetical protein